MRILHELNQLAMGGAERVVLGIIKNDKKNEHTVFSYKDGPMRGPLEEAGAKVFIEQKEGDIPELNVDVLHIHTGGSKSHLAKDVKNDIVTIETIHSPVVSAVRDEWVHARVGVSNAVTKKNRKCRTIYNGVDPDRFETEESKEAFKARLGIPKDSFVIGRVGRLGYDKCVEDWLAACWYFQKDNPDKDKIYILICGTEAEENYWANIRVMCASLPLQNVIFVEGTQDVMPVYNAMDVFLYPSPTEGFGLVYMEAMICGVPVVAWENEVTNELLMGHARLVKPSVDGLVSGLKLLYDNPDLRDEMAIDGQMLVVSDFLADRMSIGYQDLYEEAYLAAYKKAPEYKPQELIGAVEDTIAKP